MTHRRLLVALASIPLLAATAALADGPKPGPTAGHPGDEIIVCGRRIPIGTPVVTFLDPGGYDAYSTELRFPDEAPKGTPARVEPGFGVRKSAVTPADGKWDVPTLQKVVDQFVLHYDVAGTSKTCFKVLHDLRGLSVHFMLDLDGTIYQTLDLQENAWHATKANGRSIGIEIANMGAVPEAEVAGHLGPWYRTEDGKTVITLPGGLAKSGIRDKSAPLAPIRPGIVAGEIHGRTLEQYDLTARQYAALIKLTAALNATFPRITLDYPRGADGKLLRTVLPDAEYDRYHGVLGHFHVQTDKQDPGPAFQWDRVIDGAKAAR